MKTTFRHALCAVLSAVLFLGPQSAQAMTARSGPDAPIPASGAEGRAAERLQAAGLPASEASDRVAAMASEEVAHLAEGDAAVRSGGDAGTTVLLLIAVAAIVYIVFDYVYYHQAPAY